MTTKWFAWDDQDHPRPDDRGFIVQFESGHMARADVLRGAVIMDSVRPAGMPDDGPTPQPIAWCELPKPFKAPKGKSGDKYTPEFEVIWSQYPPRMNSSKWKAFLAWRSLPAASQQLVREVARQAFGYIAQQEERYRPHLSTWINERRFETVKAQKPTASAHAPAQISEDQWAGIMRTYHRTDSWNVMAYGPAPGQPGCKVPPKYL